MDQLVNVLLVIDKTHIVSLRAMNCRLGIGGLNPVYGPNLEYVWHVVQHH